MRDHDRMRLQAGIVGIALLVTAACSGDDDAQPADEPVPSATRSEAREPTTERPATDPGPTAAPTGATATTTTATERAATTFQVVEVPETGVPGLDSTDEFCAAWSRFGGSWQVLQVAANFAPDPTIVPAMEVVAAPVVDRAYEALFAAWPDELADERDAVADGYFGPLDRRAEVALDALGDAGASPDDLDAIGDAWETALAGRQQDDPIVTPELSDELWAIVDAAAADFDGRLVGFVDDPSMRITVETPETDAFLATACPDQGALTGAEVDGG